MIFCRPKDKVTHCVKEILNDGDGDGDKNSWDGYTFCGDGAGMGANPVGKGWGWGQIFVPMHLSTTKDLC